MNGHLSFALKVQESVELSEQEAFLVQGMRFQIPPETSIFAHGGNGREVQ